MGQKYLSVWLRFQYLVVGKQYRTKETGKTNKDFVCGRIETLTVFPQNRKVLTMLIFLLIGSNYIYWKKACCKRQKLNMVICVYLVSNILQKIFFEYYYTITPFT